MNHVIHPLKGAHQTLFIANISYKKTNGVFIIRELFCHLELFEFIPAEYDNLFRFVFLEGNLCETLPE